MLVAAAGQGWGCTPQLGRAQPSPVPAGRLLAGEGCPRCHGFPASPSP